MRRTAKGYDPTVLISALQKAIRRGDAHLAAYCGCELLRSGYGTWAWRRICVTAAEDVAAFVMTEINSLRAACDAERKERSGDRATRVFMSKAIIILCKAKKSRDTDHLTNLIVDRMTPEDEDLAKLLAEASADATREIPDYVYDCHTDKGRGMGRTKADFFKSEHQALFPHEPGLFDDLIEPKE